MNHNSRRFVDHEQGTILIDDGKLDRLGFQCARPCGWYGKADAVTLFQAITCLDRCAIDLHEFLPDEFLHPRSGQVLDLGSKKGIYSLVLSNLPDREGKALLGFLFHKRVPVL